MSVSSVVLGVVFGAVFGRLLYWVGRFTFRSAVRKVLADEGLIPPLETPELPETAPRRG